MGCWSLLSATVVHMINHPAVLCFPPNCAANSCTSTQGSPSGWEGQPSGLSTVTHNSCSGQSISSFLYRQGGYHFLLQLTPHWLAEDIPVIGYLRQRKTLNFKTLNTGFLVSVFPFFFFNLEECLLKKHETDHIFTLKQSKGRRKWVHFGK